MAEAMGDSGEPCGVPLRTGNGELCVLLKCSATVRLDRKEWIQSARYVGTYSMSCRSH